MARTHGYYRLRATDDGFQLSWVGATMTINLDDKGSHGPLSELYSATQHVFDEGRKSAEREQDAAALMTERVAQLGNTE